MKNKNSFIEAKMEFKLSDVNCTNYDEVEILAFKGDNITKDIVELKIIVTKIGVVDAALKRKKPKIDFKKHKNIIINEGKKQTQAVAIALSMAKKKPSKKKK